MSGGTRSYEMALRMVVKGHEVHMITSNRCNSFNLDIWQKEIIDGIVVHWLDVPYNNKMSFCKRIVSFFLFAYKSGKEAIKIGGDVIFASSTPLTIAIPAIQAKKKLKIPMVFEVRDLWPELPIAIGALKNPIIKYFAIKLELWAYKHSNQIIGLSPGMCQGVAKTGYPKKNINNIPNSCDISSFQMGKKSRIEFRKNYDWLNNEQLVIYAGTLGKINGICSLVDIATEFITLNKNVKFLIVGAGIEEQIIREKAIKQGCFENNLFMINQLPKSEMPALFSAATLSTSFFIPLKEIENNSANKFFDTLAAGKPIVINHGGWQKKLIEKYNIGLALNIDSSIAAKSLNELLLNEELINEMGTNSLALAKSHFSRDKLAGELIDVLESCVYK